MRSPSLYGAGLAQVALHLAIKEAAWRKLKSLSPLLCRSCISLRLTGAYYAYIQCLFVAPIQVPCAHFCVMSFLLLHAQLLMELSPPLYAELNYTFSCC